MGGAFRAFATTIRVLPGWAAYGLADGLAGILVLYTLATRKKSDQKRRGFFYNVRVVFRDQLTPRSHRRLLWRWARHMAHLGVDTCKLPKINAANIHRYCDVSEVDRVREQYDKGQGLLVVSGHLGVYEHIGYILPNAEITLLTIFRPSPIPPISDVINDIRSAGGQTMTDRKGGVRKSIRALRNGTAAAVMGDVSSKDSKVFAPFLGTLAATNSTAGVLHEKTGAPIVVVTANRVARSKFKFHVWDIISDSEDTQEGTKSQDIPTRINDGLSRALCEYPEQWFWDSRRFRSRPEEEQLDACGLPPQTHPEQAFPPPKAKA